MEVEWDEAKRVSNLVKHGLDFNTAMEVFDNPNLADDARTVGGEKRSRVTGRLGDKIVTVVCTQRGETTRIISMRRARKDERQRFEALHAGRAS